MLRLILLLVVTGVITKPLFAGELPPVIQQELKKVGIPESSIGIYIAKVQSSKPLIAVNADASMNPASVMKLVTTYAGLEVLGPAYNWETELYVRGKIEGEVLNGDLIIKGYGDPSLNLERFWLLVYHLRKTGIRVISGNLVLDSSHFDIRQKDPGAFDGEPYRAYNILPDALMVNYKTTLLQIEPQQDINKAQVTIDPLPESLQLINNLKLTKGRCGDSPRLLQMDVDTNPHHASGVVVMLNGQYSVHCGKKNYLLGLHDNLTYVGHLFKRLWVQQDGVLMGDIVSGNVLPGSKPFEIFQSPPLAEVIRGINKYSNNIAARQLYLTLGAEDVASAITTRNSEKVVKQWLHSKRMSFPELTIENGSGLSRIERISARHMGQLLQAAFKSPVMAEFVSSLPVAAVDGTMRKRLRKTLVKGMAHIKTGTLNAVKSMAGYLLDKSGQRKVIVFFINHPKAGHGTRAMDALLQWAYEN